MSPNEGLTLRNITREELQITFIERFENYRCRSRRLEQSKVDIRIPPFSSLTSDIRPPDDARKECLLLTFTGDKRPICIPMSRSVKAMDRHSSNEIGSESERADGDQSGDETSNPLLPVVETASKFYPVFIPAEKFLAVFSAMDMNSWMDGVHDDILLSALSIPGTHNSATYHRALPTVRCQAVSVRDQLKNGVRFLDIRLGIGKGQVLNVVHDRYAVTLFGQKRFKHILDDVKAFLDETPSETVIMSLKKDDWTKFSDVDLAVILHESYINDADNDKYWFTQPRIPRLGEARGKIVLVRRFEINAELKRQWDGRGWGIDATGWPDKTTHATCPSKQICLQDYYMLKDTDAIKMKLKYVNEQLARAADVRHECVHKILGQSLDGCESDPPIYLNFLSATNFWVTALWPQNIAKLMNPAVVDHLCRQHSSEDGDWATGVLLCDWIGKRGDWTLTKCVVGMNAWHGLSGR